MINFFFSALQGPPGGKGEKGERVSDSDMFIM